MNRAAVAAVVAGVILIAGAYGGSPYYAAYQLRQAARHADRDRLEQLVDFPEVRGHLKSEVASRLQEAVLRNPKLKHNALAALGALLAPALTDRIIDSVVTPDGVASVIRSGKVRHDSPASTAEGSEPGDMHSEVRLSSRYQDLDHFIVTVRDRRDPGRAAAVVTMTRATLLSWRVTRIELPSLLDEAEAAAASR